jgi:hypothetical protein
MQEATTAARRPRAMESAAQEQRRSDSFTLLPLGAAVLVAAAIVGWLVLHHRQPSRPALVAVGPVLVSAEQLTSESKSLGHKVYWAGPRKDWSYELTVTESGRAYVRYLPRGAAAGDPRASFLTVGTYPAASAFVNLKKVSTGPAVHSNLLPNQGLMVAPKSLPKSVYIAYPNAAYQVEVYDATAGAARRMALNGLIQPVG